MRLLALVLSLLMLAPAVFAAGGSFNAGFEVNPIWSSCDKGKGENEFS